MTVVALNCPNCGAGVESDRTVCQFCRTRLKTIGCPKCLGLMFVGSKFCEHCGAIAAPVEVSLEGSASQCPRCRERFEELKIGNTLMRGCSRCDGLWLNVSTFERVCAERESQSAVLGFLDRRTVRSQPLTKISYVPCPDCGQLMNRNNFAKASGVIVDLCKQHGVWFDADELPAIIEFIQKGGMELARQRERSEIEQERDKLREDKRKVAAKDGGTIGNSMIGDSHELGIRGFVQSLFS